jgi:hypothetical protein
MIRPVSQLSPETHARKRAVLFAILLDLPVGTAFIVVGALGGSLTILAEAIRGWLLIRPAKRPPEGFAADFIGLWGNDRSGPELRPDLRRWRPSRPLSRAGSSATLTMASRAG